jgi:glycosyltransferase involved in cell wall biosynthesis
MKAIHSSSRPTVSIVVPVHNGGDRFDMCLSSLAQVVCAPDEIIVIGDGDTDGSSQAAKDFGARVFRLPVCSGPARARNEGARIARGDILFFVDADVAVHPDAIDQVVGAFRREPDLAAVFGSYDDAPSESNFLSQYKNLMHHYVHQTAREEAFTFWAGCGAIRRDAFFAVDGFDERYRQPCIEDIELGYRLKAAGYRIRLLKALYGKHLKRWNAISLLKADFWQRALPWTELILRDRRFANDLNLDHASRASVVLAYGLVGTLGAALWWPWLLVLSAGLILALFALNAPVYRFFLRKRGLWFTLRAIPWHWLYYLYGGLAFAIGTVRHTFGVRKAPPRYA